MAYYFYAGTGITGTSTTAKVFKKSGVKNAGVGREYFNKNTGHVYKCVNGGAPDKATWRYVRTDICAKPDVAVSGLGAPTRPTNGARTLTATWKVPNALRDAKNGRRAEEIDCTWFLGIAGKDPKEVRRLSAGAGQSTLNLNNCQIGSKTYTRDSFYPVSKTKLAYVTAMVQGKNSKGLGKAVTAQRKFLAPRKPLITGFAFNKETGSVSVHVKTDPGNDYRERYDTWIRVTVTNTRTGKTWQSRNGAVRTTDATVSFDAADYQMLSYNEYIRIKVEAWARGYAGDSERVSFVHYVSYPAQATIKSAKCSSKDSTGKCTVYISTNQSAKENVTKSGERTHPVDRVMLEYLANVGYSKAGQIPADAGWTSGDVMDDGECTALALPVSELMPSAGRYTWVRVKSWHDHEGILYRYSAPYRLKELETPEPTAADDDVVILSVEPGTDGESAVVHLGWNADGQDDSTGTELSWATEEDSWKSTDPPDTYRFEWSDGEVTHEGVHYLDSATITIKKLDDGVPTFIRARRYLEADETSYGEYCNTQSVIPTSTPESVTLNVPPFITRGAPLPVSWTYGGNGMQRSWQLLDSTSSYVEGEPAVIDPETGEVDEDATPATADPVSTFIAEGSDPLGSHQIPAERIAAFAVDNRIAMHVQVSTGGDYVASEPKLIEIADPPTLSVTANQITAQPAAFTAECDVEARLLVTVSSQGVDGQTPHGTRRQPAGDCIFTGVFNPRIPVRQDPSEPLDDFEFEWDEGQATVALPTGLDFIDKGVYTLTVVAVDPRTGLESAPATAEWTVAWSHQAPVPEFEVEGQDAIAEDGTHLMQAVLTLTAPDGAAEADVADIYRLTGDGAELVGQGFPLDGTYTDEFAPFGTAMDLRYRVAIRTADGDTEFAEAEYELPSDFMRIDWDGGYVELPYDIQVGDSYKKDVETRKHLDGSTEAYWNDGVTRTSRLSTDIIRLDSQELVADVRRLARHAGPAFVRTPDGSAYTADVQVTDMSTTGVLEAVSIDCTEVGIVAAYMLPVPFAEPEPEEE